MEGFYRGDPTPIGIRDKKKKKKMKNTYIYIKREVGHLVSFDA